MKEITIIAFNYGKAGKYVNGPGMCLVNFVKKLKQINIKVNVFSEKRSDLKEAKPLNDLSINKCILRSEILHHWSGIGSNYVKHINFAKKNNIKTIIGPNVLDTVKLDLEKKFLSAVKADHFLTVNERLKHRLSSIYKLPLDIFEILLVGPDEDLWFKNNYDNGKILWKGNSKQFVKDINFALDISKYLDKYKFEFIGYPEPYSYNEHIELAKQCHVYFSTSLSETMGLTVLESCYSGLPVVIHPKIYLNLKNYQAGIITNRDINSYCEAIEELMENTDLYQKLSLGAIKYVEEEFSNVAKKYWEKYGKSS